ncbi:MAG TPA: DUF6297 family protein [Nocardioidaceae bacterium]|nr:DUF6297 family protein [Nocardioidaceae bacterium]
MSGATEVRELRGQIRNWRRGRAELSLAEAIGDAYIAVFATIMLGSMGISVILNLRNASGALCTTQTCSTARDVMPWLFAGVEVAVCLGVARLFGPMLVSPAIGTWLLSAPVDRSALLLPRLAGTGTAAFVVGGALAAVGGTLAGFSAGTIAAFAVSTAAVCLCTVTLTTVVQARGGPAAKIATWLVAGLVWAAVVALVLQMLPAPAAQQRFSPAWLAALVVTAVLAVGSVVRAVADLPRIHRDRLAPGGSLVPSLSGALATLDLALIYDILVSRRWLARSTVRPHRGGPKGAAALVWRDLIRLRRSPQTVVVPAAAIVVPYLGARLGIGEGLVLLIGLTGFLAGLGLCSALRVLSRTPGLMRCLPLERWEVRAATLAVPAVVLLVWGLATAPAVHEAIVGTTWGTACWVAAALGVAALTAVTRWMTAAPPDYLKPLVSSPMGAVPTSLFGSLARGFDVLLLLCAPLLLASPANGAFISLVLSGAVLTFLLHRP